MRGDEYLAGFFDGEGHVGITPSTGTALFLLEVHVTQVDPTPLLMFKARFGGKVSGPHPQRNPRHRPTYSYVAQARVAERVVRALLPYLVVKRAQAELALEFRKLFSGGNILPRGRGVNAHPDTRLRVLTARADCYAQMRHLNSRGVAL